MKTLKIGSGTTFNISIELPEEISTYKNVLLSIYTDELFPVRFSYIEKAGFNKIDSDETGLILSATLTAEQTAKMKGCMYMVMKFSENLEDENIGTSIPTPILDGNGLQVELVNNNLKSAV